MASVSAVRVPVSEALGADVALVTFRVPVDSAGRWDPVSVVAAFESFDLRTFVPLPAALDDFDPSFLAILGLFFGAFEVPALDDSDLPLSFVPDDFFDFSPPSFAPVVWIPPRSVVCSALFD